MRDGQASSTHVRAIVEGLRRSGWSVSLVAISPSTPRGILWRALAAGAASLRCLQRICTSDVVYVRWHPAALPAVLTSWMLRRHVVLEVNGTGEDWLTAWPTIRPLSRMLGWSGRAQLRLADGVIAVTQGLADWVTSISGNHATAVVPNGVDPDMFAPLGRGDGQRYVAFVGALAPWQGVETMLEAALRPEWPRDVDLVIAGDGALRRACERAARDARVHYVGPLPPGEVPKLVGRSLASLSVQSAASERGLVGCSPIKLFEGMAVGRPVVVTDLPGVADPVRAARCGIVVPPGDARQLASAVSLLANDERTANDMGERGRRAAVREHSWTARAAATASFLESLLS
jgi:glycosyltransferase involved in cell wall biosynthesis